MLSLSLSLYFFRNCSILTKVYTREYRYYCQGRETCVVSLSRRKKEKKEERTRGKKRKCEGKGRRKRKGWTYSTRLRAPECSTVTRPFEIFEALPTAARITLEIDVAWPRDLSGPLEKPVLDISRLLHPLSATRTRRCVCEHIYYSCP